MSAEEARDYGIIDSIFMNRPEATQTEPKEASVA